MIDVSIVKYDGSAYSIKSSIFDKSGKALLKVLYLYEVKLTGGASYQKIRTMYDASVDNTKFNNVKYKGIFDKLIEELTKKYGYTTIMI